MKKKIQNKSIIKGLNQQAPKLVRWCTPSIDPSIKKIKDIYESDISVSYHKLGNPFINTGCFKQARKEAALVYKADNTLFTVNGTTGSNFIVLKSLQKQLSKMRLLAQRNIHKSISAAIEDFKIETYFLKPNYDQKLELFFPNSLESILKGIETYHPNVLLLTLPTYEGYSINLKKVIRKIREKNPNVIIFIDEAWGSHITFSNKLPFSAMEANADICVQSTHKQGSALQQTSMIHWNDKRINGSILNDSFIDLSTTSPSFHLLASLEGAVYFWKNNGVKRLKEIIKLSSYFRKELQKIAGIEVVNPRRIALEVDSVDSSDLTKISFKIKNKSAYLLAHRLEEKHNIIVEKYSNNNILLIFTLQSGKKEVDFTLNKIKHELNLMKNSDLLKPKFPDDIITKLQTFQIDEKEVISIEIALSAGYIAAENVVPYPPGIPLFIKGEIIRKNHIDYIKALNKSEGLMTIIMSDKSKKTIKVIKK